MIIVAGAARIRTDRRDEAARLVRQMGEQTRREPGCVTSAYYASLESPETFFLYQVWESEEALSAHYRQDFVRAFLDRLPEMLDGTTAVQFLNRYETDEGSPL